jgi:hypothetical protein
MDDQSEILWRMYNEHVIMGRHHETQRSTMSQIIPEVLQSKLHSSSQGETLALRLFHKPSKIKVLNVFVVD